VRRSMADTTETMVRASSGRRRLAGVLGFAAVMGALLTAGSPAATPGGSSATTRSAAARLSLAAETAPVERTTAAVVATPTTVATPAPAPIHDLATPEGKGAAALDLVDYPVEKTGYTVVFAGARPGYLGLTEPPARRITIFVRPEQTVAEVAHVLGHELGHVVDLTLTTPEERLQYRLIRGLDPHRSWFPSCDGCTDYAFPAGDFAETFAIWLVGEGTSRSTMAGPPTAAQLAQLDAIFSAHSV
jgi:hypothetical protein